MRGVSAFSRIATLHSKQPKGRSGTSNTGQQKSGLIAFNAKHNPHSTTLPSASYAVTTLPLPYPIFKSSFLPCLALGGRHPRCRCDFLGLHRIMAPTIQVPAARTFSILENVFKKRTNANRILKEREKEMLGGEGYDRIEVDLDNKPFLQPVDAEDTKASVYYVGQKLILYRQQGALV